MGLFDILAGASQGLDQGLAEGRQNYLQSLALQRQQNQDKFNYLNQITQGIENGNYNGDTAKAMWQGLGYDPMNVTTPNMVTQTSHVPVAGPTPDGGHLPDATVTQQVQDGTKQANLFDTLHAKPVFREMTPGSAYGYTDPSTGQTTVAGSVPWTIDPNKQFQWQTRMDIAQDHFANQMEIAKVKSDIATQVAMLMGNSRVDAANARANAPKIINYADPKTGQAMIGLTDGNGGFTPLNVAAAGKQFQQAQQQPVDPNDAWKYAMNRLPLTMDEKMHGPSTANQVQRERLAQQYVQQMSGGGLVRSLLAKKAQDPVFGNQ